MIEMRAFAGPMPDIVEIVLPPGRPWRKSENPTEKLTKSVKVELRAFSPLLVEALKGSTDVEAFRTALRILDRVLPSDGQLDPWQRGYLDHLLGRSRSLPYSILGERETSSQVLRKLTNYVSRLFIEDDSGQRAASAFRQLLNQCPTTPRALQATASVVVKTFGLAAEMLRCEPLEGSSRRGSLPGQILTDRGLPLIPLPEDRIAVLRSPAVLSAGESYLRELVGRGSLGDFLSELVVLRRTDLLGRPDFHDHTRSLIQSCSKRLLGMGPDLVPDDLIAALRDITQLMVLLPAIQSDGTAPSAHESTRNLVTRAAVFALHAMSVFGGSDEGKTTDVHATISAVKEVLRLSHGILELSSPSGAIRGSVVGPALRQFYRVFSDVIWRSHECIFPTLLLARHCNVPEVAGHLARELNEKYLDRSLHKRAKGSPRKKGISDFPNTEWPDTPKLIPDLLTEILVTALRCPTDTLEAKGFHLWWTKEPVQSDVDQARDRLEKTRPRLLDQLRREYFHDAARTMISLAQPLDIGSPRIDSNSAVADRGPDPRLTELAALFQLRTVHRDDAPQIARQAVRILDPGDPLGRHFPLLGDPIAVRVTQGLITRLAQTTNTLPPLRAAPVVDELALRHELGAVLIDARFRSSPETVQRFGAVINQHSVLPANGPKPQPDRRSYQLIGESTRRLLRHERAGDFLQVFIRWAEREVTAYTVRAFAGNDRRAHQTLLIQVLDTLSLANRDNPQLFDLPSKLNSRFLSFIDHSDRCYREHYGGSVPLAGSIFEAMLSASLIDQTGRLEPVAEAKLPAAWAFVIDFVSNDSGRSLAEANFRADPTPYEAKVMLEFGQVLRFVAINAIARKKWAEAVLMSDYQTRLANWARGVNGRGQPADVRAVRIEAHVLLAEAYSQRYDINSGQKNRKAARRDAQEVFDLLSKLAGVEEPDGSPIALRHARLQKGPWQERSEIRPKKR